MSDASKKNDTRADDCAEGQALLLRHVLDGLRAGGCKPSFLAVAQRVLSEETERLARLKTFDFGAVTADLPFPSDDDGTGIDPKAVRPVDADMAAMLASLPFKTDEEDGAA